MRAAKASLRPPRSSLATVECTLCVFRWLHFPPRRLCCRCRQWSLRQTFCKSPGNRREGTFLNRRGASCHAGLHTLSALLLPAAIHGHNHGMPVEQCLRTRSLHFEIHDFCGCDAETPGIRDLALGLSRFQSIAR